MINGVVANEGDEITKQVSQSKKSILKEIHPQINKWGLGKGNTELKEKSNSCFGGADHSKTALSQDRAICFSFFDETLWL